MLRIMFVFAFSWIFLHSAWAQNDLLRQKAADELRKIPRPHSTGEFKAIPHLPPMNQDTTNACWSFSTLSFVESEMLRLGRPKVRLAVMFPVYYGFLEKARYFVTTKGSSRFAPGDLFSGVLEIIRKYGIVPQSVYRGQTRSCRTYNHSNMETELSQFMQRVKELELWDEEIVVAGVRKILDKYMGAPPRNFTFNGKTYTPQSFRDQVVNLPWDEYVAVTSFLYEPYGRFIELKVPDNWAHRKNYFNVPLPLFYSALISAVRRGYSAAIDADISEPGRLGKKDVSFIPSFDLPAAAIDEYARELRFVNKATTDDHLMHIVGYKKVAGQDWFLVKDSWRSAWYGQQKGYFFFHGDYIRLKVLAYLVHREAVPALRLPEGTN